MKKQTVALLLLTSVVFSGCRKAPDSTPADIDESVPVNSVSTSVTGNPDEEYLDVYLVNATYTPNDVYFREIRYCRSEDKDSDNTYFLDISREKIDYIVSYLETADVPDAFRYSGENLLSPE